MHTPGPWETKIDDYGIVYVCSKDGLIADNLLDTSLGDIPPEEAKEFSDNATLIAAAPDLFEACKMLLCHAHGCDCDNTNEKNNTKCYYCNAKDVLDSVGG